MKYGFVRAAACAPALHVADCDFNASSIIGAIDEASARGVTLLALPELCITGYTCGDLFLQEPLLRAAEQALLRIAAATRGRHMLVVAGVPLRQHGKLYNCAAVLCGGRVLGVVPKTHIPNYGEFYELRHFSPAPAGLSELELGGEAVPFGTDLLFCSQDLPELKLAVEICEDLWVPSPPSSRHAAAGATVIINCSASDEAVGKTEYRRQLIPGQSARCVCGYVYASAGADESTTDLVFSGHHLIAENGAVLAESRPFSGEMAVSEIDVQRLAYERRRMNTFAAVSGSPYREIPFETGLCGGTLTRAVPRHPFVPSDDTARAERCEAILTMQARGLKKRLEHSHAKTAVIGISGGLDSCLALLVAVRAIDLLGLPRRDVIAVTMPCFGTTARTRRNAEELCTQLGVTLRCVDITDSVRQHFRDIGHDENDHSVTYENAQARQRTLVLMDIANQTGGLVVGTGDLSELALGWATYNGDHMSMYGVNAGVPKTLVRHIVATVAAQSDDDLRRVLLDILDTPVSPELLPPGGGEISQKTEDLVGPYELHDFFLYYIIRWGFSPAKVLFLAQKAFDGDYSRQTLLHWLRNFYRRFFAQQFKRSCLPDGPKIGSVTLSPRGDWRMPSDACADLWLKELDALEQEELS